MSESPDSSITQWFHGACRGEEQAIEHLWGVYFQRLIQLAKQRLVRAGRRVSDEEDVAVSVFAGFCTAARDGQFADLKNRDELWRLLVTMTHGKLVDRARYETRAKRGGGLVRGDSIFVGSPTASTLDDFLGTEPTPDFLVSIAEEMEQRLTSMADDARQIALLKLDGYTNSEVASALGISPRSVERKLALIRTQWLTS
jgi:DNA-directed RNA polymerase specialized sigma24 family protein